MSRRVHVAGALVLAAACLAQPVHASDYEIGVEGGYFSMAAKKSAEAVFGTAGSVTGGLSLGRPLGRSFFARLGGRFVSRTGERVFVADASAPVFPLGHELSMRVLPIYLLGTYRLHPDAAFVPYAGAGVGATLYRERSLVAGDETTQTQTKAGFHFAAGADLHRGRLRFGGEMMYTLVPNALGVGGVSQVYGETDLGGLSVLARISFNP